MTVALVSGAIPVPLRLLRSRNPEQLTLGQLNYGEFAQNVLFNFANLAQKLDISKSSSMQMKINFKIPPGLLPLINDCIKNLSQGLTSLKEPTQALALPTNIAQTSRFGQLVAKDQGYALLIMLKLMQKLLTQNQQATVAFEYTARGWNVIIDGESIFLLDRQVVEAIATLSGPAGNMTPQEALDAATQGLIDFAKNNIVRVNPLACASWRELATYDPRYAGALVMLTQKLMKQADALKLGPGEEIRFGQQIKILDDLNLQSEELAHIINLLEQEIANPTVASLTAQQLGLTATGGDQSALVPFQALTPDVLRVAVLALKAHQREQSFFAGKRLNGTVVLFFGKNSDDLFKEIANRKSDAAPTENIVELPPSKLREMFNTLTRGISQLGQYIADGSINISL
jgi:hypothetical protein